MATIIAAAGAAGNWTAGGAWVGGVAPTAADSVQITGTTTSLTIDTGAVCRGADLTGFTGTLSHTAGVTLNIGDGTAALSNIALKFPSSGWTYSLGDAATSAINFISTSSTQQSVNFGGQTTGNVTFNAASNGSWQYTGGHTTGATATVNLTKGSLDVNGQTCSWGLFTAANANVKSFTLGGAQIGITGVGTVWAITNTTFTFPANTSTITFSGVGVTVNFGTGVTTYNNIVFTGGGTTIQNNTFTCVNFTKTGTNSKTSVHQVSSGTMTVTGTLTLGGNTTQGINRLLAQSSTAGTQRTIAASGAAVVINGDVDFQDITITGSPSWTNTGVAYVGDCGGNGGVVSTNATVAATQTHTASAGGNWSDSTKWTSRAPLPQDNVVIDSNTTGTITLDMPRLGQSIDFTGFVGTSAFSSVAVTNFGSFAFASGQSVSGTLSITFSGYSTHTITSNGKTFPNSITFQCGNYSLVDDIVATGDFSLTSGTFDNSTANKNITCSRFNKNNTNTATLNLGSATIKLNNTGVSNIILISSVGLTFNAGTSNFVVNAASTSTRTINCTAGMTLYDLTYTLAGSTGNLAIVASNTFHDINFSDASNARILSFTAGITTTITGNFNVNGTSTKLMTIQSATAAGHTLSSANQQSCDFLSISRSTAQGGGSWYAGANSTDGGNNAGWIFTAPPSTATARLRSLLGVGL